VTHIFNEKTTIIGVEATDGRLPVQTDPTDRLTMYELLEGILLELQKINIHLALLTDNEVTESDIGRE